MCSTRFAPTLFALILASGAASPAAADDTVERAAGGLLTAPSFSEIVQPDDDYYHSTGGYHPHIYGRGAISLVFPFDTEVERDSGISDDLELNSKVGFGYNTSVGIRMGPGKNPSDSGIGYRFEAEFAQRYYDTDSIIDEDGSTVEDIDGDIEVTTIMGNALLDVTTGIYRGYGGIGAGIAFVDADINGETDDDTSFALQIPLGIETRITDNLWIDVGTRWMWVPSLDIDTDITEFSILTADVYVGLLLEF